MRQSILHNEIVKVSQTTRQWVLSIVLLILVIYFGMMLYFYNQGIIPNTEFEKDDFIAVSIILTIVSIVVLIITFSREFKITIDTNKLTLQQKGIKEKNIDKNTIKNYKNINRKEYSKLINEEYGNRRKRKARRIRNQFATGTPNFLITLNSGQKLFVQTNKKASFEYAMNKMLNN